MMARSLMQALALAVMEMRSRRHECLTVEHLLLAMTREHLGRVILKGCGADIPALRHQLEEYLSRYLPATGPEPSAESEVLQTEALERVLERAVAHVQSSGRRDADIGDVLAAMFEERLNIPTALTNDANAAAIGEMTYGAARGMKDFIMITLGTGVGSGIVINGQMVYGHDGFAGELGHTIIRRENGRLCGCGRHGCLETYCSATGVARTAREFLTARTEESLLRAIPAEAITSKDVYDAAVKGDKLAQDIFEYTGQILGEALADAIAFSSPEAIILFGGLAKAGDLIFKPVQRAIDENVLNIYKGKAKLLMSELKDSDAAVLGASALGWEIKNAK